MKNILILLLAVLFVNCKKESEIVTESLPVANFTTDKAEYDAGDVMILTNTSSNADNVRFTLPNGTTSRNASVSYSIDPLIGNVNLIVKLEAISKSGAKSDYIIKGIHINPGKGILTLYSSFRQATNVQISIDGNAVANANLDYTLGMPSDCNQSGYSSYTVVAGVHSLYYSYYSGTQYFYGTKSFTMTTGGCEIINCN